MVKWALGKRYQQRQTTVTDRERRGIIPRDAEEEEDDDGEELLTPLYSYRYSVGNAFVGLPAASAYRTSLLMPKLMEQFNHALQQTVVDEQAVLASLSPSRGGDEMPPTPVSPIRLSYVQEEEETSGDEGGAAAAAAQSESPTLPPTLYIPTTSLELPSPVPSFAPPELPPQRMPMHRFASEGVIHTRNSLARTSSTTMLASSTFMSYSAYLADDYDDTSSCYDSSSSDIDTIELTRRESPLLPLTECPLPTLAAGFVDLVRDHLHPSRIIQA